MINNLFEKSERSTFKYWLAHLFAFNMVALKCNRWRFKYLFHDFEKPWLKLFLPYEKVQKIHRKLSRHHLDRFKDKDFLYSVGFSDPDWYAMVIDWECSRYTKFSAQKTAYETIPYEVERFTDPFVRKYVKNKLISVCKELGLA